MFSPLSNLLNIARTVSKIGIASINTGITKDVRVVILNPKSDITAIINPKNVLPESPINILAGGKLLTKNPKVAPSIIKDKIISNPPILFIYNAIIEIVKKYIELIPDASPSSPSIKFIALVIARIKNVDKK